MTEVEKGRFSWWPGEMHYSKLLEPRYKVMGQEVLPFGLIQLHISETCGF